MYDPNDHITGIGTLIHYSAESEIDTLQHQEFGKPTKEVVVRATMVVRREFMEYDAKQPKEGFFHSCENIPGLGTLVELERAFVDGYELRVSRIFEERIPMDKFVGCYPAPEAVQKFVALGEGYDEKLRELYTDYEYASGVYMEPTKEGTFQEMIEGKANACTFPVADKVTQTTTFIPNKKCPDCKGTGEYHGFSIVEPCHTCNGTGKV